MTAFFCLWMAVYHEARSEPLVGQFAVAHVILNRVRSERYPDNVCAVVKQPNQFPFHWDLPKKSRAEVQAQRVAYHALAGYSADPTGGALYYYRRELGVLPWVWGMHPKVIGKHVFWRTSRGL